MLSAWVAHKRPAGAPQLTYGRTVAKAMGCVVLRVLFARRPRNALLNATL